jgi:hypothetical protein
MLSAASLFSTIGNNLLQHEGELIVPWIGDGTATADLFHMDAPECEIEIGFRTGLQEGETRIHEVKTGLDLLKTLADIGVSAGDILQAHKVLWVEGPTDIPAFKKWVFTNPRRGSQTSRSASSSRRSDTGRSQQHYAQA